MDIESLRAHCLRKPGVTESLPFGPDVLVFKVMGKIFALAGLEPYTGFSAKCDPERAVELRERYPGDIAAAWHLNKRHWNQVETGSTVPEALQQELINHSYDLVVASLTRKLREELAKMT